MFNENEMTELADVEKEVSLIYSFVRFMYTDMICSLIDQFRIGKNVHRTRLEENEKFNNSKWDYGYLAFGSMQRENFLINRSFLNLWMFQLSNDDDDVDEHGNRIFFEMLKQTISISLKNL